LFLAGTVDQNPPHRLSGRSEEMASTIPVLAVRIVLAYEPKVGFVDQGRGLKGLARPLFRHLMSGQPAQFVIDHREKSIGHVVAGPSTFSGSQNPRDFIHRLIEQG
jgi:hypothetical protein